MAPDKAETPRLYLIDGSSFIYRAYHALPHLSNREGEPTGAVLGFVNMLQKTLRDEGPTHVAVAFDTRAKTFRHEKFPEYKANRAKMPEDLAPQIPRIHEVVEAMNLPLLTLDGWEADDVVGTLAVKAVEKGWDVVIVSGDKDFMQLLTRPGLRIYDGMKDRWFDEAQAMKKFGVEPAKILDAMALIGDSSDNIPGVKGIGPKTAGKLLEGRADLEDLLAHLDEVKSKSQREKLEAGVESARMSRDLVTIALDAPIEVDLESFALKSPDEAHLHRLFTELEFTNKLAELGPVKNIDTEAYTTLLTEDELKALVTRLESAPVFAVDTETTGKDPMQVDLVGMSFSFEKGQGCYLPLAHRYIGAPKQVPMATALDLVRPVLEDASRPKVLQNAKYDLIVLRRHGIALDGVSGDPMIFDYLLDPGKPGHGMDALSEQELGHRPIAYSEVAGKGKKQVTFDMVPVENATPYAAEDADVTLRLANLLRPRVEKAGLWGLFETLELPLMGVLADMEMVGVPVDASRLSVLAEEFEGRLKELQAACYDHAGQEFSINSPKQLGKILFEDLGLPVIKKTKTGPSTDMSVLEQLAEEHPLPRAVLDYRHVSKLKSTYIDALPQLIHPKTGRIHTSFSQTTAATGRLASSDPNLQNIPIRSEDGRRIRRAFVAPEGRRLVSADYSQIELRILAHLAQDEVVLEAFRNGEDIHARTASEILGVPPDEVTPAHRTIAKAINFGIVYGMSAFRLAREQDLDRAEAQAYIDGYFERYAGVARWLEKTREEAHETGMVTTLLGRRRLLPDLKSRNHNIRSAAERTAINTPIQGTAADVIKLAMLAVHRGLPEVCAEAALILQVHDELMVECPEADAERVGAWLSETMEGAMDLSVRLAVEVGIGRSWDEVH